MGAVVVLVVALIGATPPALAVILQARKDRKQRSTIAVLNTQEHNVVVERISDLRTTVQLMRNDLKEHVDSHG
jgi:hypothetical protein